MEDIKDYKEYESLFTDDLVIIIREILKKVEDNCGFELEDSTLHNQLIQYFNKFALHEKISESEFKTRK